MRKGDLI